MQDDLFAPAKPVAVGLWPSEQLAAYLGGKDTSPSPAIRSWAQFYVHEAAKQICGMDTKEKRRIVLGKIPDAIRPDVEAEIKRIWPLLR